MRPTTTFSENKAYECFVCGNRVGADQSGTCPSCGGSLLQLGRSRDL